MTIDYQKIVLRYLFQNSKGRFYIQHLDESIFDDKVDKAVFVLLKEYYKVYDVKPSEPNIKFFLEKNSLNHDFDFIEKLKGIISKYYIALDPDQQIIEDTLLDMCRKKMLKEIFINNVSLIESGDDQFFKRLYKDVSRVTNLDAESTDSNGVFLSDEITILEESVQSHPTLLRQLNRMTGGGGFKIPELIIFLAGPKCFKTGIMLNLALDFTEWGLNVFYADFENGVHALKERVDQRLLHCGEGDVDKHRGILSEIKQKRKMLRCGDIRFERFKARKDTLDAVEAALDKLKIEHDWEPDVIIYDYIDLAEAPREAGKDKRLKIQHNYHQAININEERGTFSISISKMKANSFNNEFATIRDFGEDSEKAYNCHRSFYISRTEEDIERGLARIFALVQRQGISFSKKVYCPIKINEEIQMIEEIDIERVSEEEITDL